MEFDGLKQKKKFHMLFFLHSIANNPLLKKKKKSHNRKRTGLGIVSQVFNPDFLLCPWANHQNLSLSFLICESSKLNEIVHYVQL